MYLKTLPIVPVKPSTGRIPESETLTSVFLPMLAEKGFGVPVRSIDGDYLTAFLQRINGLCDVTAVGSLLGNHLVRKLRTFQVSPNRALRQDPPTRDKIISDHTVSVHTRADMLELLIVSEELDVAWVGLQTTTDCRREQFLPEHRIYMQLIHGLEETGVLRGIKYEYDVLYEDKRVPPVADIRTFYVDCYRILEQVRRNRDAKQDVLNGLEEGRAIDTDADPLLDYFHAAYELNDPNQIRHLKFDARVAVGRYVGGRSHDVAQVTAVKSY